MKTIVSLVVAAVVCGGWIQEATGQAQPGRALFFPSNELLPPSGLYVSPPQSWIGGPNGPIISNLVLRGFTVSVPAPPPGTSATFTFQAEADFDLASIPGGASSQVAVPVELTLTLSANSTPGTAGGYVGSIVEFKPLRALPGNLSLRQSSAQPSNGQFTLTPVAGGFLISSFFDVFLDVSTDGGQTWLPLNPSQHLDLRADPSNPFVAALVAEPAPLFPAPDDQVLLPAVQMGSFAGGIQIKNLRQTLFSGATDLASLPLGATATVLPYTSVIDFDLSVDGGQTFTTMRTSGNLTLTLMKLRGSDSSLVDAELTQMDFSASLPGAAVLFRESPTLSSFGGAELRAFADGSFQMSSFFDVFLEASTDGGQTWNALISGPLHFQLQPNSLRLHSASSNLPTPGGQYVTGPLAFQTGPRGGVLIAGNTIGGFSASSAPPVAGQRLVQDFTAQVNLRISVDGGVTFTDAAGTAAASMLVTKSSINWGDTSYYDAELTQLDVTGLPGGVLLRESPTKASSGRLSITPLPAGGFQVNSFFDVFSEISLDGGQTWTASPKAVPATLNTTPAILPLTITCPGDVTVLATSSAGAVVNYPSPYVTGDCPLVLNISYSPASGSQLPIGTTTVTVTATDGCGEHTTCSFNVHVLPNYGLLPPYVFTHALFPPPGGMLVGPVGFGAVSVGGIILSNFTLSNFPRSATPPAAGASLTLDTTPTADFDWSVDGGATFTHAQTTVRMLLNIQDVAPGQFPGQELYNLQLLGLDISGGGLPSGAQLRVSPSRASTGQFSLLTLSGSSPAQNQLIGLLDVFLDASTDGGLTWAPAGASLHLELRPDPATLTPVPEFTPLWSPPADQLSGAGGAPVQFPGGMQIRNLTEALFSSAFDLSLLTPSPAPVAQQFSATAELDWSQDGGQTFTHARVPVLIGLLLQGLRPGMVSVFDASVTQMDFTGGDLPPNLGLRASRSLTSQGQIALQAMGDGSFQATSFFDVFFELSTDGGRTWQPANNGPLRLNLEGTSQIARFASSNLPPSGSQYVTPAGATLTYRLPTGAIIVVRNEILTGFTSSFPPPPPGQSKPIEFRGQLNLQLSTDGGKTFNAVSAPASVQVTLTGNGSIDWGDRQFVDAQLLQFMAAGGTLPSGILLRQSSTRPSLGRTGIQPDAAGGFRIGSFYDFAQDLSTDGGQSWNPAVEGPIHIVLNPNPGFAPYGLTCPADITVHATSASGAVVNFSLPPPGPPFPDCPLCCFEATCTPPSGSLFPIGTTTVLCQGHDGCDETPTCSFTVTVLPGSPYSGVLTRPLGIATLSFFHGGTGDPISMVVSNLGASGSDGFHLDLGGAGSLVLNFDPYPNNDITDMVSTVTGLYAGDPNHVLGTSIYHGGTDAMVFADFSSIGATSLVARVTDENHQTLSSQVIPNGSWFGVNNLFPPGCTNPTSTVCTYTVGPGLTCWKFCRYGCNCLGTNCTITRVVCFFELAAPALSITGFDFMAQGSNALASLTIQSAEIGQFGNLHTISGNASLELDTGLVIVDGIGSSGDDGVNVNLNHVGGVGVTFAPLRLLAQNACLTFNGAGDVNGLPAIQFGSASIGGSGGTLALNGNFDGLGATQIRVEGYLNGAFQWGVGLPAGLLGNLSLNGNLIGAGTLAPVPGFYMRFDSQFSFNTGGQNLMADEIRIMALNPTKLVRGLTGLGIRSCNTGQIAILGESVIPLLGRVTLSAGGGVVISGQGAAGQTYRLQAAPALAPQTSWRTVGSVEADDEGYFELSDTPSGAQQFYRTITP